VTDARLGQAELDELWDHGDAAESERRFRAAEDAETRGDAVRAELETQRARAIGLQGRYDEADAVLDRIPSLGPLVATRVALERGRVRLSSGDAAAAVPRFLEALGSARDAESPFLAVDAMHMLALSDAGREEHWTRLALVELHAVDDHRTQRWRIALHNNLGWHLFDAGHAAPALEEFAAALGAARDFGTSDQRFMGEWTVARCLRQLGRTTEALAIQSRLASERPDDPDVAAEIAALTDAAPTIEE
jgi:tetratricopeptide (TPR) repeat protein